MATRLLPARASLPRRLIFPSSRATAPAAPSHVVVNNQIGFTTSAAYARSGTYCTDVAKMIQAPIFHVNGDDAEAVVHVARSPPNSASNSRKDVVIDIFCYRRHGHNEGDEPAFTQPIMYKAIAKQPTTREIYAEALIAEGV